MSQSAGPVGMVDSLAGLGGGPTEDALAFAEAYLAEGEMDPAVLARATDPERIAERERLTAEQRAIDWPALGYYRDANAALAGQRVEVVFLGDSLTEMWRIAQPDLFQNGVVNRGISGQTSPQMLLRFMADVVALKPRAVHLMCGANDIAGNTGPTTPQDYKANVLAMLELARAHEIEMILASLCPISGLPWAPGVQDPKDRVAELNDWLGGLAAARGLVHPDYHAVLSDDVGGLREDLTRDGVHPNARGYGLMRPLAAAALAAVRG